MNFMSKQYYRFEIKHRNFSLCEAYASMIQTKNCLLAHFVELQNSPINSNSTHSIIYSKFFFDEGNKRRKKHQLTFIYFNEQYNAYQYR